MDVIFRFCYDQPQNRTKKNMLAEGNAAFKEKMNTEIRTSDSNLYGKLETLLKLCADGNGKKF